MVSNIFNKIPCVKKDETKKIKSQKPISGNEMPGIERLDSLYEEKMPGIERLDSLYEEKMPGIERLGSAHVDGGAELGKDENEVITINFNIFKTEYPSFNILYSKQEVLEEPSFLELKKTGFLFKTNLLEEDELDFEFKDSKKMGWYLSEPTEDQKLYAEIDTNERKYLFHNYYLDTYWKKTVSGFPKMVFMSVESNLLPKRIYIRRVRRQSISSKYVGYWIWKCLLYLSYIGYYACIITCYILLFKDEYEYVRASYTWLQLFWEANVMWISDAWATMYSHLLLLQNLFSKFENKELDAGPYPVHNSKLVAAPLTNYQLYYEADKNTKFLQAYHDYKNRNNPWYWIRQYMADQQRENIKNIVRNHPEYPFKEFSDPYLKADNNGYPYKHNYHQYLLYDWMKENSWIGMIADWVNWLDELYFTSDNEFRVAYQAWLLKYNVIREITAYENNNLWNLPISEMQYNMRPSLDTWTAHNPQLVLNELREWNLFLNHQVEPGQRFINTSVGLFDPQYYMDNSLEDWQHKALTRYGLPWELNTYMAYRRLNNVKEYKSNKRWWSQMPFLETHENKLEHEIYRLDLRRKIIREFENSLEKQLDPKKKRKLYYMGNPKDGFRQINLKYEKYLEDESENKKKLNLVTKKYLDLVKKNLYLHYISTKNDDNILSTPDINKYYLEDKTNEIEEKPIDMLQILFDAMKKKTIVNAELEIMLDDYDMTKNETLITNKDINNLNKYKMNDLMTKKLNIDDTKIDDKKVTYRDEQFLDIKDWSSDINDQSFNIKDDSVDESYNFFDDDDVHSNANEDFSDEEDENFYDEEDDSLNEDLLTEEDNFVNENTLSKKKKLLRQNIVNNSMVKGKKRRNKSVKRTRTRRGIKSKKRIIGKSRILDNTNNWLDYKKKLNDWGEHREIARKLMYRYHKKLKNPYMKNKDFFLNEYKSRVSERLHHTNHWSINDYTYSDEDINDLWDTWLSNTKNFSADSLDLFKKQLKIADAFQSDEKWREEFEKYIDEPNEDDDLEENNNAIIYSKNLNVDIHNSVETRKNLMKQFTMFNTYDNAMLESILAQNWHNNVARDVLATFYRRDRQSAIDYVSLINRNLRLWRHYYENYWWPMYVNNLTHDLEREKINNLGLNWMEVTRTHPKELGTTLAKYKNVEDQINKCYKNYLLDNSVSFKFGNKEYEVPSTLVSSKNLLKLELVHNIYDKALNPSLTPAMLISDRIEARALERRNVEIRGNETTKLLLKNHLNYVFSKDELSINDRLTVQQLFDNINLLRSSVHKPIEQLESERLKLNKLLSILNEKNLYNLCKLSPVKLRNELDIKLPLRSLMYDWYVNLKKNIPEKKQRDFMGFLLDFKKRAKRLHEKQYEPSTIFNKNFWIEQNAYLPLRKKKLDANKLADRDFDEYIKEINFNYKKIIFNFLNKHMKRVNRYNYYESSWLKKRKQKEPPFMLDDQPNVYSKKRKKDIRYRKYRKTDLAAEIIYELDDHLEDAINNLPISTRKFWYLKPRWFDDVPFNRYLLDKKEGLTPAQSSWANLWQESLKDRRQHIYSYIARGRPNPAMNINFAHDFETKKLSNNVFGDSAFHMNPGFNLELIPDSNEHVIYPWTPGFVDAVRNNYYATASKYRGYVYADVYPCWDNMPILYKYFMSNSPSLWSYLESFNDFLEDVWFQIDRIIPVNDISWELIENIMNTSFEDNYEKLIEYLFLPDPEYFIPEWAKFPNPYFEDVEEIWLPIRRDPSENQWYNYGHFLLSNGIYDPENYDWIPFHEFYVWFTSPEYEKFIWNWYRRVGERTRTQNIDSSIFYRNKYFLPLLEKHFHYSKAQSNSMNEYSLTNQILIPRMMKTPKLMDDLQISSLHPMFKTNYFWNTTNPFFVVTSDRIEPYKNRLRPTWNMGFFRLDADTQFINPVLKSRVDKAYSGETNIQDPEVSEDPKRLYDIARRYDAEGNIIRGDPNEDNEEEEMEFYRTIWTPNIGLMDDKYQSDDIIDSDEQEETGLWSKSYIYQDRYLDTINKRLEQHQYNSYLYDKDYIYGFKNWNPQSYDDYDSIDDSADPVAVMDLSLLDIKRPFEYSPITSNPEYIDYMIREYESNERKSQNKAYLYKYNISNNSWYFYWVNRAIADLSITPNYNDWAKFVIFKTTKFPTIVNTFDREKAAIEMLANYEKLKRWLDQLLLSSRRQEYDLIIDHYDEKQLFSFLDKWINHPETVDLDDYNDRKQYKEYMKNIDIIEKNLRVKDILDVTDFTEELNKLENEFEGMIERLNIDRKDITFIEFHEKKFSALKSKLLSEWLVTNKINLKDDLNISDYELLASKLDVEVEFLRFEYLNMLYALIDELKRNKKS
jgi:hypothetical protein